MHQEQPPFAYSCAEESHAFAALISVVCRPDALPYPLAKMPCVDRAHCIYIYVLDQKDVQIRTRAHMLCCVTGTGGLLDSPAYLG